jgi:hypothetical protein
MTVERVEATGSAFLPPLLTGNRVRRDRCVSKDETSRAERQSTTGWQLAVAASRAAATRHDPPRRTFGLREVPAPTVCSRSIGRSR